MATQAERDAHGVVGKIVNLEVLNRELQPLIRMNPKAQEVSARIEGEARGALRLACILWFGSDTLADLEPPAA